MIRFKKPKKKAKVNKAIATVGAPPQRKPVAAAPAPAAKKDVVASNKTLLSFGEEDE